jgi:hypothetical protein
MIFTSLIFLIFLAAVFLTGFPLGKWRGAQNILLPVTRYVAIEGAQLFYTPEKE